MNNHKRSWQENLVFAVDIFIITFCYIAAYFIRFDGLPEAKYFNMMMAALPLVLAARMATFLYFKLHESIWEYASIKDLTQILKATTISSAFIVALLLALEIGHPRAVFIIDWLLLVMGISGVRFFIRITRPIRWRRRDSNSRRKKVLIVGAGDAGEMILREMVYRYNFNYEVVGLIDDDPRKYGKSIHTVTVLGRRSDIPEIVKKKNIDEIIIAIPSLNPDQMRDIINYCIKSGARYRTVPNISHLVDGTVKVKELREVRLEDLLKREEVSLDRQRIASYITGKVILITGAGGSIGSELCRQVARFNPLKLILFEKSENSLFYIDMELEQFFKDLKKVPIVGDICDRKRVREVFAQHRPQIIFHAAAHKHVPLMELNPSEAVKNNIFGTRTLVEEAIKGGVEKFITLSTDKVVSPTSVMGITKRITEIYLQSLRRVDRTKFMVVRFGNVLGSEGSVIPTFKRQIEKGGPVTVTHPEIKRYFMTIPEAAMLVLEAGSMGEGGEIFILEMGRQIKILDLAHDMIKLSGLIPQKDIKITFSGLRPGEKLHEALITEDESLRKTTNEKISIVEEYRRYPGDIFADLDELKDIVETSDIPSLIKKLKEIVPRYKPSIFITEERAFQKIGKTECLGADILIADDEKIIQELLSKFLEGRGYNTLLASNGKEALDAITDNDIKVAIVDIRMPGFMNGLQALKNIKRINKNVAVIIITGFGTKKAHRQANEFGAYAYLEKPLDLIEVKRQVERALSLDKDEGLS